MKKTLFALSALLFMLMPALAAQPSFAQGTPLPTREAPLVVDKEGKRVLIYTEVNEKNLHDKNPHWGIVSKEGKFADKAILRAYAHHLAFYDALVEIGAKPGNNLNKDALDVPVEGDRLEITATWAGLGKELKLSEIFYDETGKGFDIRFGGNRQASEENNTGCITCLESCWISITSNANYPSISSIKRSLSPNSQFKGLEGALPGGEKPVIVIYHLK